MVGKTGIWKIGQLVAVLAIFGIGFIGTASALDLGDPDISVKILAPDEFMPDSTYFIGIKYIVNEVSLFDEPASYPEIFFDAGSAEIVANLSGRFNATNTTHTCTFNLTGEIAEKRDETVVVIIKTSSSGSVDLQVTANAHDDDDYDDIVTATDSVSVSIEEVNSNSVEYFKELAEQRKMLFERYLYLVNGTLLSQSEMEKISDEGMQTALFKITSASYEMALDEMMGSAAGAFIDPLVGVDGAYDYMDYTNNMITGFEGNPLLAAVNWMFGWCEWILGQIFLTWNIQSSFDGTGSPTPDEPLNQYISLIDEEITCWETNDFEGLKSILKAEKELHEYSSKYSCVSNSDRIKDSEMYSEDTKNYVKILYESVDKAIDSDYTLIDRYIEPAIEAPAPRFVSMPGANVDLGSDEEYDFVFRIENDGGTANDSYFSLSVSGGLEITGYSSDKSNGEFTIYHKDELIWYHDEYRIPAEYTLLDWYRPWLGAGEAQTLTVTIKGTADGDQWIKYRLAFDPKLDEMSFVRNPTSGELDQQGWNTYGIDVTVDDVANGRPGADFSFSVDAMSASFASLATDPDGDPLSYYWDFDDGSSSTAESPAHEYGSGGGYDVTFTVTDTKGLSDYETKRVRVNEEPEADFSYYAIGTEVMFTSTSTDDGSIVSWDWDFGDSGAGAGEVVSHEYSSAGSYDVMLTVTDDGGKSDSDTVVVAVTANAAPVADAGCDQSVASGAVVTLDGSGSSDSDGTIEYYEWQEDGVFLGSGATLETVFAQGVHEITLYVVDDGGKVGSDEARVEVSGESSTADIYVNTTGWWRDGSTFNSSSTPIQAAVDAASTGNLIFVYNGSYTENVNMNKKLTLEGEGADVVNVTASYIAHVFTVTTDLVNISGFRVNGTTDNNMAGIYLGNVNHCNISGNTISDNDYGIYLWHSNDNLLTGNNLAIHNVAASSSWIRCGIRLNYNSHDNIIRNNTVSSNYHGIRVFSSDNNTIADNNASNNACGVGVHSSNNNTLTNNTINSSRLHGIVLSGSNNILAGNTVFNIGLESRGAGVRMGGYNNIFTNNNVSNNAKGIELAGYNNTLTCNTANLNEYNGITLCSGCSNNIITNNTANSNGAYGIRVLSGNNVIISNTFSRNKDGIELYPYPSSPCINNIIKNNTINFNNNTGIKIYSSNNNTITCNLVQNNTRGIDLSDSTNNNISYNNIIKNGEPQADGSYHWQLDNTQPNSVEVRHNYWGTGMNNSTIDASIYDDDDSSYCGEVKFYPFETNPITCAPRPESTTDTTPPTLTITSPAPNTTTHTPTITIAGTASDASGIASVTVNGEPANGTLDWSANVTLSECENTITVVATDGEGLTTTAAVTVRYEPLRGDLNHDGILTPADAAIALQLAAGSSASRDPAMLDAADVSGDGRVTSLDALMILQAAAENMEL